MKHLKRFNESSEEELPYNEDLIEDLKELSLEYLDEDCILNYFIQSLDEKTIFYGGEYSHHRDRFNKYSNIDRPFRYMVMISDEHKSRQVSLFNRELSIELVDRLKEIYPGENIITRD
jgi:hypothetical protein